MRALTVCHCLDAAPVLSSMLYYTFPALIHKFDNGDGGNCAIFDKWHQHQDFKVPRCFPVPQWRSLLSNGVCMYDVLTSCLLRVRTTCQVAGYLLRGLRCYFKASAGGVVCFDGATQCPDIVTPEYLTRAPGQGICQVRMPHGRGG